MVHVDTSYSNIIFQILFSTFVLEYHCQVSIRNQSHDTLWYRIESIRSILSISRRTHAGIGVCLVLILVPWQATFLRETGGWRWPAGIIYKYFSLLPLLCLSPSLLSSFLFSALSLSRSPRAIHQRKSTGVLAFPFFGCSNELAVSLVASLPSFTLPSPHLSFRLCPSLLLSWPVNLPFFAICEGLGVHSRYQLQRAVCRKARPLFDISVIFRVRYISRLRPMRARSRNCQWTLLLFVFFIVSNLTRISRNRISRNRIFTVSRWK